jgi:nitrogen-specific signal transduction histidine kinase/ActR/RegA family two-component response regulator
VVEWGTDGAAVRVVGTHTDISERKEAEEKNRRLQAQLRQAQKLEAIGTLAGGIAHDFNNILGAMIGFTDMVIEDLPENSLHHSELRKVLQAGHRARDLIGQILAFSRQSDARRLTLQPQAIIKEVAKLLRSTLPTTIDIKRTIAPGCSAIDADPTQFHQILMNLCTNAYHAMEDSGGTLTISLRPASVLPETLRRQSERTNDSYLELLIADTGQGMSPAIVEKIFDPFFTTKVKEKGTGMGLSIVYGIVSEYGGAVSVESEVGIGSTFHVFWPCSPKPDITAQAKQEVVAGGTERIMLVDDEELLLEMTGKMLERCGYRVTPVTDSRRAGELFGENPDIYDLVITDQTMPGLTGMELAKQMMSVRPDLPIILCTGYSASVDEGRVKEAGLSALIFKPLLKNELLALIRSVLVGDSSEPSLCPEAV